MITLSTKQRRNIVHHLIRCGILGAFGLYIVYLARTGTLVLFVEPNLAVPVKLSAIGLFATAIYQFQSAVQEWQGIEAAACDCNHEPPRSLLANLVVYTLFLLPLAIGIIF
ncbi:DUF1980 domain-containing protein [Paenibacillus rhizovicinus]|uniref:DUF1980 domain-containing protein n=1 Tax=Paenibacillus rhizovicinus TaxID=2704463 RepID=A0A6C0NXA4_9BACL|nr:DUF1980 domain-containing protein [Paenibacillus rhizovicinus]QHW30771.1 DUF1980 domain-containing protein [Paenibacillus rhizovicinus]